MVNLKRAMLLIVLVGAKVRQMKMLPVELREVLSDPSITIVLK
jgi:hypothetical protein